MVSCFPLDYMHLVCLGVMRRLLYCWIEGPLAVRLDSKTVLLISKRLLQMVSCIPRDFVRKPRALFEIRMWKATEFRQFLLYTGPVALEGLLPKRLYDNFMLFSVSINLLCSPKLCKSLCDYANQLLVTFVVSFKVLYGNGMLVYNVHSLTHLAADVNKYGPLDNFSAFPFENALKNIKKLVRKPRYPLQQIARRLKEKNYVNSVVKHFELGSDKLQKRKYNGIVPDKRFRSFEQYEAVTINNMYLSTISTADNCIILNDKKPYLIRNIFNNESGPFLVLEQLQDLSDFNRYPLPSSRIGIMCGGFSGGTSHYKTVKGSDIISKSVCIPICYKEDNERYVIIPLLHSK